MKIFPIYKPLARFRVVDLGAHKVRALGGIRNVYHVQRAILLFGRVVWRRVDYWYDAEIARIDAQRRYEQATQVLRPGHGVIFEVP